MRALRRALYLQALAWGLSGIAFAVVPRQVLAGLLGQPPYEDYAPARIGGVEALALALLAVLVAQRAEELWWWSWAFVVSAAGTAAVATLHAALGVPEGASAWPWWTVGAVQWMLAAAIVWGIGRAAQEAPPP